MFCHAIHCLEGLSEKQTAKPVSDWIHIGRDQALGFDYVPK